MRKLPRDLGAGRFRLGARLGRGGEKVVVRARDLLEDREVVLKWDLDPETPSASRDLEARLLFEHPHLATPDDAFHDPAVGGAVTIEAWVPGSDLTAAVADGLDATGLEAAIRQIESALHHLHAAGWRHGDVKPGNILVRRGAVDVHAVLIDFGLLSRLDEAPLGGTPGFLAPEFRRGEAGAAADWYALGATLAALLGGLAGDAAARERLAALAEGLRQADPHRRALAVAARRRAHPPSVAAVTPSLPADAPLARTLRDAVAAAVAGSAPRLRIALRDEADGPRLARRLTLERRAHGRPALTLVGPFRESEFALRLSLELGRRWDRAAGESDASSRDLGLDRLVRHRGEERPLIVLGPAAARSPAGVELQRRFAEEIGATLVVLDAGTGSPDLELALGREDAAALIRAARPESLADPVALDRTAEELETLSGGSVARAAELVGRAVAAGVLGGEAGRFRVELRELRALGARTATRSDSDLAAGPRSLLERLLADPSPLDAEDLAEREHREVGEILDDLRTLERAGLAFRTGRGPRAPIVGPAANAGADAPRPLDAADLRARDDALARRLEPWLVSARPDLIAVRVDRITGGGAAAVAAPQLAALAIRGCLAAGELDDARARLEPLARSDRTTQAELEGEIALAAGDPRAGAEALARARASTRDDRRRASRLATREAYARLLAGDPAAAAAVLEPFARGDAEDEPRERAARRTMLAAARERLGEADAGRELYREAEALYDAAGEPGTPPRPAATSACSSIARESSTARRDSSTRRSPCSRRRKRRPARGRAQNRAVVAAARGDLDDAVAGQERADRLFRLTGQPSAPPPRGPHGARPPRRGSLVAADARSRTALPPSPRLARGPVAASSPRAQTADLLTGRRRAFAARRRELAALVEAGDEAPEEAVRFLLAADPAALLRGETWDERRDASAPDDLLARLTGALAAAHRAEDRAAAAAALSPLLDLRPTLEQARSSRERTVFRAAVVNPALEALLRRLEGLLAGEAPPAAAGPGGGTAAEVLRRIRDAADLEAALDAVVRSALEVTPAVRALVLAPDEQPLRLLAAAGAGADPLATVSRHVVEDARREGRPVFVDDASGDPRLGFAASVQREGLVSIACIPLVAKDRPLGVLYLDSPIEREAFDEAARPLLMTWADLAQTALELFLRAESERDAGRRLRREMTRRTRELATHREELSRAREREGHGTIVGRAPAIERLNELIRKVAPSDLGVLVIGESGAGKELVAQALHARSNRRGGPFIAVNAATLPPGLVESELFGHVRGAFSGATEARTGLFELASGGTLFLDEVGDLGAPAQAAILRVLETGRLRPVGGSRERSVDVRVVAASNRPLRGAEGFREDLYFRLAAVELAVPPLRERIADLPLLVETLARRTERQPPAFDASALEVLERHVWPGNVRELRNLLDRLAVLAPDGATIGPEMLPPEIRRGGELPPTLEEARLAAARRAMEFTGGNKLEAARLLGVSRTTLYKLLDEA
ncbi:MAG: sigma 54-interacting transcriptional regulator [Planctomycetota bacterium]